MSLASSVAGRPFFSQIDEGCPLRGVVYDVFLTESGIIFLHESKNHGVQSISSHCGDGVYGHSATPEAQNLRGGGRGGSRVSRVTHAFLLLRARHRATHQRTPPLSPRNHHAIMSQQWSAIVAQTSSSARALKRSATPRGHETVCDPSTRSPSVPIGQSVPRR